MSELKQTERERLENVLRSLLVKEDGRCLIRVSKIVADYLIEDRRRVLEPLLRYKQGVPVSVWGFKVGDSEIDATLKRAGLTEDV